MEITPLMNEPIRGKAAVTPQELIRTRGGNVGKRNLVVPAHPTASVGGGGTTTPTHAVQMGIAGRRKYRSAGGKD